MTQQEQTAELLRLIGVIRETSDALVLADATVKLAKEELVKADEVFKVAKREFELHIEKMLMGEEVDV